MKSAGVNSMEQVFLHLMLKMDTKNKYPTYRTTPDLNFLEATRRTPGELSNTHNKIKKNKA